MKILILAAAAFLDVLLQSGIAGQSALALVAVGLVVRGLAMPLPQ
jgi:hypothetical protein